MAASDMRKRLRVRTSFFFFSHSPPLRLGSAPTRISVAWRGFACPFPSILLDRAWLRLIRGRGAPNKERDPKGLYAKVAAGEIKSFTGMSADAPYEEPPNPEIRLPNYKMTVRFGFGLGVPLGLRAARRRCGRRLPRASGSLFFHSLPFSHVLVCLRNHLPHSPLLTLACLPSSATP